MLDLKIVGGTIIDGTGTPRFIGDVGTRGGRIVAIGQITEPAHQVIDAQGLLVAPGFIDCHTHYDAQVFWDPALTPSCFHGVTTVIGGFCGFSIAPMTPDAATYIRPMLARVEGMPLDTLESAVPWGTWSTFGDFLAAIEGRAGLNVGFFCGHSTLRRIVMGARAVGERASSDEVARMKALLATSLKQGALGFSTTISPTHSDADGNPVPSRWADFSELLELAGEVRNHEGTGLELLPDLEFDRSVVELMIDFSLAGDRPVNWNALAVTGRDRAAYTARAESMLRVSDAARDRGAEVIALTIPAAPLIYMNLRNGVGFDSLPGFWRTIFKLPIPERKVKFGDPEVRKKLAADARSVPESSPFAFKVAFADYIVAAPGEANRALRFRRVGEIAGERGQSALDTLLDIALADDLTTVFAPDTAAEDRAAYEFRAKLWRDDRTLIGASDAGAHLDMIDTFAFSTTTLEKGVREHGVISVEEAVHLMTDRIARYFGLIDRGRIEPGFRADIAIIDGDSVGRGPAYLRYDVPGGAARIYADAKGVPHVIVNGVQVVRNGEHTGAMPGTVLRSGRDTQTTPIGAMRNASRLA